jgi:hypothetical protein
MKRETTSFTGKFLTYDESLYYDFKGKIQGTVRDYGHYKDNFAYENHDETTSFTTGGYGKLEQ